MKLQSYKGTCATDLLNRIHRQHGDNALIVKTHNTGGYVEIEVAVREAAVSCPLPGTHPTPQLLEHLLKRPLSQKEHQSIDVLKMHILQALRVYCGVVPLKEGIPEAPRWIFEGRPGVGKTTCLLKIATACALKGIPVHIISLDGYKTETHSTLHHFSTHTQTPVHYAADQEDLLRIISTCHKGHKILVDTPGMGHEEDTYNHGFDLDHLEKSHHFTRCFVHDALSDPTQSVPLIAHFLKTHKGRCVTLMKMDLTYTPESLIHTLIDLKQATFLGQSLSPLMTECLQSLPLERWTDWLSHHKKAI